jgi:cell division protein FtsL
MATLQPAAPRSAPKRTTAPRRPAPAALPAARPAIRRPDLDPRGFGVRRAVVRLSRLVIVAFVLLLMGGLGIFQVLQSSRVATLGYQLRTLDQERSTLSADVGQLEAQVAERSNLERVHTEAVDRLGMVPPSTTVTVHVDAPAPAVIPLPRRYVAPTDPVAPAQASWWERLLAKLPGFN